MFGEKKADITVLDKDDQDYAQRVIEKEEFSEFIEFRDNFLAGNWSKRFGLFVFQDTRKKTKLNSWFKIVTDTQQSEQLSIYNFPYHLTEFVIKPLLEQNRYFSKDGEFITITSDDFIDPDVDLSLWEEHKCSASKLTPQQYNYVMATINDMDEKEAKEILAHRNNKIKNQIEKYLPHRKIVSTYKERPFLIRIAGNDDCTYYQSFATEKDAWECYNKIKENAMTSDSYDLMHNLGFLTD